MLGGTPWGHSTAFKGAEQAYSREQKKGLEEIPSLIESRERKSRQITR
jgi:hypothetical protein